MPNSNESFDILKADIVFMTLRNDQQTSRILVSTYARTHARTRTRDGIYQVTGQSGLVVTTQYCIPKDTTRPQAYVCR